MTQNEIIVNLNKFVKFVEEGDPWKDTLPKSILFNLWDEEITDKISSIIKTLEPENIELIVKHNLKICQNITPENFKIKLEEYNGTKRDIPNNLPLEVLQMGRLANSYFYYDNERTKIDVPDLEGGGKKNTKTKKNTKKIRGTK